MEDLSCSPFNWDFCHEEEGIEEFWYSLFCRTLELETKVASAKEEITKKEDELENLKDFLSIAIKERDEAESKCEIIMLDIVTLRNQLQQQHQKQKQEEIGSHNVIELANHFVPCQTQEKIIVTNDFDEDNFMDKYSVLQPPFESSPSPSPSPSSPLTLLSQLRPSAEKLAAGKVLPEKGKLLQAVMEAGPLLQTLLLAGPLPQWQHPPPRIDAVEIPPVAISRPPPPPLTTTTQRFFRQEKYCFSHKRSVPYSEQGYGFSYNTKYQKVVHQ